MTPKIFAALPMPRVRPAWEYLIIESRYGPSGTISLRLNGEQAVYEKGLGFRFEGEVLGDSWYKVFEVVGEMGWGCFSAYHSDQGHVFYFQRVRID